MKNICIIKKCAVLLVLVISAALFLSAPAFAQGTVVGYADGRTWIDIKQQYIRTTFPTNAQLDRLTHVIAADIGCRNNGTLFVGKLQNSWNSNPTDNIWNGQKNLWIESLVNRAHAKGVKVSICVGGEYFASATNSTYLNTFVANIASFVNLHGLDGVDIDWEDPAPADADEWIQCIDLLTALKSSLSLSGKRISIALPSAHPGNTNTFHALTSPALPVARQIWNKADAIHLMTYDEGGWQTHSYAASANSLITNWATWGTTNGNLDKAKLYVGCAFYGYNTNNTNLWSEENKVSYDTYSLIGFPGNPGDTPASVTTKTSHFLNNGYGGVFIWELGYDANTTATPTLQNAIWSVLPTITGPNRICNSGTYTVTTIPSGYTVTWIPGPDMSLSNTTGSSVTVQLTGSGTSASWLGANLINSNSGDIITLRQHYITKYLAPQFYAIYGNTQVSVPYSSGSPVREIYEVDGRFDDGTVLHWSGFDQWATTGGYNHATFTVGFTTNHIGGGYLSCYAVTPCNQSASHSIWVDVTGGYGGWYSSYPNPASNVLNIEINKAEYAQSRASTQSLTDAKSLKQDPTFDIRLYDGQGNLLRHAKAKDGNVQFNVSGLPNGIYYLHIYDGISEKPEMRQIIVEK